MPIHRDDQRSATGMKPLGKLRKGEMVEGRSGNTHPVDLKHFRVLWEDERFENTTSDPALDEVRDAWQRLYGDEPARFENVYITTGDPHQDEWLEKWSRTKKGVPFLEVRCDNQTQVAHHDFKADPPTLSHVPIPCARHDKKKPCPLGCKPIFRLGFYLRDLIRESGVVGYFLLELSTEREIENTIAAIKWARNLADTYGAPRGDIPFVMYRQDGAMTVPGVTGQQMRSYVHLEPDAGWVKMMMERGDQQQLGSGQYTALQPPDDVIEGELGTDVPPEDELTVLSRLHFEEDSFRGLCYTLAISRDEAGFLDEKGLKALVMKRAAEQALPMLVYNVTIEQWADKNGGNPYAVFDVGFGKAYASDISKLPKHLKVGTLARLEPRYRLAIQTSTKPGIYTVEWYEPDTVATKE